MADSKDTPKFSEDKVDDLIAAHGREPSKKDMNAIEAMIETERRKMQVRQKIKEANKAKKLKRGMDRGM